LFNTTYFLQKFKTLFNTYSFIVKTRRLQTFQHSRNNLKSMDTRSVTWSKFHTENPKIFYLFIYVHVVTLGTTIKYLIAMTIRHRWVYFLSKLYIYIYIYIYIKLDVSVCTYISPLPNTDNKTSRNKGLSL